LRRRATPASTRPRLARGRGGRQLGRPAGEQGRRPQGWAADALADPRGASTRRARGARAVIGGVARRARDLQPVRSVAAAGRAGSLERAGVDVVHLEYGEPDFEAPAVVRDALEKALKDGRARYTHSLGIVELREAIAEHYARAYGVTVSPDQVLVTPGTSPAMLLLFGHLLDPGDEVVLSNPYYACYPTFIRYADGVPTDVDVTEADRFQYRPEAIRERLSGRTKAIVVNSPANPTGSVLAADRMRAIADLARERGVAI